MGEALKRSRPPAEGGSTVPGRTSQSAIPQADEATLIAASIRQRAPGTMTRASTSVSEQAAAPPLRLVNSSRSRPRCGSRGPE